jgi:hypothetical protein
MSYNQMANIAAQGAGQAYRENAMRRPGGRQIPGMASMQEECHFPAPPSFRCYCHPAAFHAVDGRNFHLLTVAYGASRPCGQSY